jgi:hypothetical protein
LARSGHNDSVFSEHAANIALQTWLARSGVETDRRRAAEMAPFIRRERDALSPEEASQLTDRVLEGIRARFDQLSEEWSKLATGDSLRLLWPDGTELDEANLAWKPFGG